MQESKINLENFKRIMHEKNTTLSSLRNVEWRSIMTETKKKSSTNIDINKKTNRIKWTNLCGSKLIFEETGVP